MPHCYFHLTAGAVLLRDEEGSDLIDVEAARGQALKAAREILSQSLLASGRLDLAQQIDIADGAGRTLLAVPFGTAVTVELPD
jgi:hypothetical protein